MGAEEEPSIRELLVKLKDDRGDVSLKAAEALTERGPVVIPHLTEYVSRERSCFGRLNALLILTELDRENPAVVPALRKILTNLCTISPFKDMLQRRAAAFLMGTSGDGIRELARLLSGQRRFVRRSAIFVLDNVAETTDTAPADVVEALTESLPLIARATRDRDRVVRDMAWEVLDELAATSNPDLCRQAVITRNRLHGTELPQGALRSCEAGYQAFERSDYHKAERELLPLAEKGDGRAMYLLSEIYRAGSGVPNDLQLELKWLKRAAEYGYAPAQTKLGQSALIEHECVTAATRLAAAARQDDALAQFQLGSMYERGHCVPQDFRHAAEWYDRAAQQKKLEALFRLGWLLENGRGVSRNKRKAAGLYYEAALEGYLPAVFKMGMMYLRGRGVPEDHVEALIWFFRSGVITPRGTPQAYFIERHARSEIAPALGEVEDLDEPKRLLEKLRPDQISSAKHIASQPWRRIHRPAN